ncbi:DNA-binding protein WhiA [Christensenellaceae bacterium OttesenSCG-928-K19]|nr:DNA-binding protein WhiA [Christensenellaceae bacterium OttesenSCG-928-K19]
MESFSASAKNEICQLSQDDCCVMAELCAITFVCGNLSINSSGVHLLYNTENKAVAKRIFDTLTRVLKLEAEVLIKENQLKKINTYTVVAKDAPLLLAALGIEGNLLTDATPPGYLTEKECCKIAMLRGAFLGGGTVSSPKKNYHFEFVVNSESFSRLLCSILEYFQIKAKTIHRKQNYVVYLNEGDSIVSLLALIGAHTSILNLENVRILKEMRNNVNRAVNCETANINKTVNAAMAQLQSIHIIEQKTGIEKLSDSLREAAILRLENPEATLQELCELGGTTKSGMNHRLRKIKQIAESLSKEDLP